MPDENDLALTLDNFKFRVIAEVSTVVPRLGRRVWIEIELVKKKPTAYHMLYPVLSENNETFLAVHKNPTQTIQWILPSQ